MPARATMGKRAIRTSARRKIARNRCRADRSPPWRTVPFDLACAASVSFARLRASCSRSSSIARTRLARDLEVGCSFVVVARGALGVHVPVELVRRGRELGMQVLVRLQLALVLEEVL